MENARIRKALRDGDVRAWELAEALGIVDCTLSKWMRRELPTEQQDEMLRLIDEIVRRKAREEGAE